MTVENLENGGVGAGGESAAGAAVVDSSATSDSTAAGAQSDLSSASGAGSADGSAAAAVESHTNTPTLLGGEAEPPADKTKTTAEVKAEVTGEQPKAENPAEKKDPAGTETVAEVVQPPVYTDFNLPEGLVVPAETLDAFKSILASNNLPQEAGQTLLDMHVNAIRQLQESAVQEQHRAFGDMRRGWRDEVMADERLGGAGHQTAMSQIRSLRDQFVPADQAAKFNEFLLITGAGDNPAFLRFLHNISQRLQEPKAPAVAGNPPPNAGKPGPRRAMVYDHPRSHVNRT